ncbi:MAG: uracil-DNA glycosylase [Bacilli bacterium]|jgi:uracil-DNA glycosylase|nr:uracil-DNA glycosylase [Bacilli bacterium]
MVNLENDWAPLLAAEFTKPYYLQLRRTLQEEYQTKIIYPGADDVLAALRITSYANTKVVILGQDPYHGAGQAHGLSFSVKPGVKSPPSLQNIFKELQSDLGCAIPKHGCLLSWAEQGVLLLNSVLSVRAGDASSHKNLGWETFTDQLITLLNQRKKPVVFILWGNFAQQKAQLITDTRHRIIHSAHPSPFSAYKGFFGSRPFSQANLFLEEIGSEAIDWQLTDHG